jgi:hypothetical protein
MVKISALSISVHNNVAFSSIIEEVHVAELCPTQ